MKTDIINAPRETDPQGNAIPIPTEETLTPETDALPELVRLIHKLPGGAVILADAAVVEAVGVMICASQTLADFDGELARRVRARERAGADGNGAAWARASAWLQAAPNAGAAVARREIEARLQFLRVAWVAICNLIDEVGRTAKPLRTERHQLLSGLARAEASIQPAEAKAGHGYEGAIAKIETTLLPLEKTLQDLSLIRSIVIERARMLDSTLVIGGAITAPSSWGVFLGKSAIAAKRYVSRRIGELEVSDAA